MVLRICVVALFLGFAVPFLPAQEEASPDAAAIEEAITGLKQALKEKIDADQAHFIKILAEKWASADAKQRKEIHDLAGRNLKNKSSEVREATVEALSKMSGGPKDKDAETSTKMLDDETKKKTTEDDLTYFSRVLVAMGKLQRPTGLRSLTKLLKHKDNEIVAAAAEGLGNFRGAPFEMRRDAVEEIIKTYSSVESAANDTRDTTAGEKLKKVKPAMDNALKGLTGQQAASAFEWQRWWNNEGKRTKGWGEVAEEKKG